MTEQLDRVLDERNRLYDLIDAEANVTMTDTGYSFVDGTGELVYEFGGHRYQVTLAEIGAV